MFTNSLSIFTDSVLNCGPGSAGSKTDGMVGTLSRNSRSVKRLDSGDLLGRGVFSSGPVPGMESPTSGEAVGGKGAGPSSASFTIEAREVCDPFADLDPSLELSTPLSFSVDKLA